MKTLVTALLLTFIFACKSDDTVPEITLDGSLYFPSSTAWETQDKSTLGITDKELSDLKSFLETNDTRAFLILKDGKIVVEEYFGKDILNGSDFEQESLWYWASAGKSLTAFTVGLAQEQGLLNINDKTSDYLGENWTTLSKEKEDLITVKHQLSMTAGLDIDVADSHCFEPSCLQYKADAGQRWDYHNGPYTLLHDVLASASGKNFETYFEENLRDKIGMNGVWRFVDNDHVYFSDARSFARFGLLVLNKGDWGDEVIMSDKTFFDEMVNTSQSLNEAYGYLWWLNGKQTGMVPGLQTVFKSMLSPNAPSDMVAAMGLNGQLLNVVPSQNLVVVRMGDSPGGQIGLTFQNALWSELNQILD
ncbi:serine hydrolase domain-containing protein [Arcticibacterium luteifluviistationis]|uniref:Serine hydrolase n=1 Tax=Arcticibacterium luteifluviistationis TaxID=1784714 RepID=A0A2Z4GBZ2_9BACT|nr:serine hydrolase [Arcticibacterium luteifluviistationis]AWV98819.1 serine hydrolase [Arcticibacterium luteifluviistationis]